MKEYGSYVAARGLREGRVSTLRGVDRLTGMPVLLYTLSTPAPLPALDHPRLLPYTDYGRAHDVHFVVVALPPAATRVTDPLVAARGALSALAHLHERGLVHGGITPEQLWLVDGGAALAGASLPWGELGGGFDAPEGGKSAAADLFALGRTLDALGARPEGLGYLTDPDPARRGTAQEALVRLNAPAALQPGSGAVSSANLPDLSPLVIDDTFVDASRMTAGRAGGADGRGGPKSVPAEGERGAPPERVPLAKQVPSPGGASVVTGAARAPDPTAQDSTAPDPTGQQAGLTVPADTEASTPQDGAGVRVLPGQAEADAAGHDDQNAPVQPPEPDAQDTHEEPDAPLVTVISAAPPSDRTPASEGSSPVMEGQLAPDAQPTADAPVVTEGPVPLQNRAEAHEGTSSLRHQPIRIGWEEDHSWRVVKSGPEPARPAGPARRRALNPLALAAVALVVLIALVLLLRGAQSAPTLAACCDVRFTVSGERGVTARLMVQSAPAGTPFRPGDELAVAPGEVTLPDVPGTYRLRVLADGFEPGTLEIRVPRDQLVQIELGR